MFDGAVIRIVDMYLLVLFWVLFDWVVVWVGVGVCGTVVVGVSEALCCCCCCCCCCCWDDEVFVVACGGIGESDFFSTIKLP